MTIVNNDEGTNMNDIAIYTQAQMDSVRAEVTELRTNLNTAYRNIVESLEFEVRKGSIELYEMRLILEGAKVPSEYYNHLFTVTVMVEIEATSTVSIVKQFQVEVDSDYTEDDLLEAFDEQYGMTASEIISEDQWDADWQDEDLTVGSSYTL